MQQRFQAFEREFDLPAQAVDGMIEIITGRERRRRWGVSAKLRIVAESEEAEKERATV
jgi:hypothetical protein